MKKSIYSTPQVGYKRERPSEAAKAMITAYVAYLARKHKLDPYWTLK